jgi:cardiolipin synthase (CMP-forming)
MTLTWPTILTLFRIVLIPALILLFYLPGDAARWSALAVFIVAGVTDWLDGYLARTTNAHSRLGEMLDPIADKLIVAAALVLLVWDRTIEHYALIPALVIIGREILVSGLREYLAGAQVKLRVSRIAKWKTVLQIAAICVLIGAKPVEAIFPDIVWIGTLGLWIAAAATVYTGWAYLQASLKHIEARDP